MIRPLTKEDLGRISALEQECFQHPWTLPQWEKEFDSNPFGCGLVEEDQTVRGYIWIWITYEDSQLVRIGVQPDAQGKGIGTKLLKEALCLCKDKGCHQMSLDVEKDNQSAIHLYESCGFVYSHTSKKYYKNGQDARIYTCDCTKGERI